MTGRGDVVAEPATAPAGEARSALLLAFRRAAVINATLLKLHAAHEIEQLPDAYSAAIDAAIQALERASAPPAVRAAEERLAAMVQDGVAAAGERVRAREQEFTETIALLSDAIAALHGANTVFTEQVLDRSARMQDIVTTGDLAQLRVVLTEELQALRQGVRAKQEAETAEIGALRGRVGALEERLQTMTARAHVDPLTGVHNRAAWDERLAAIDTNGDHLLYAVALLDVDNLKQINDAGGHAAGDAVLAAFGAYCRQAFGSGDFVARIGGDEFAALITAPASAPLSEHAADHVERLMELVRRASAPPQRSEHAPFSVSAGLIATGHSGIRTRVTRADAALYVAKRGGRDRLVLDEG